MADRVFVIGSKIDHSRVVRQIIKTAVLYLCLITALVLITTHEIKRAHRSKVSLSAIRYSMQASNEKLRKIVAENVAISKTQALLRDASSEPAQANGSYVRAIKSVINDLAFAYKINSPAIARISSARDDKGGAMRAARIDILINASSDEPIIQFIDALSMNLNGVSVGNDMVIIKNSGSVAGKVSLSWYGLGSNFSGSPFNILVKAYPHKMQRNSLRQYKASEWQGSLMRFD